MKKPELLAPAGGMEQLAYALYFGADAIYLACDKFGLRQRAQNFSLEELPGAVKLAHEWNAHVFVTCNAYAHDKDLEELPAYARALEEAGVDAVIVSDLGVLSIIKQYAPSVALHISTQASVSNAEAAKVLYGLGARRIVCAREMSLEEIAQLKRSIPEDMEVEVFVHGAMCMAISGRCLISDYLTGRSANQGHCVQPCRWEYVLEETSRPGQYFPIEEDESGTYLMNSKDLNMLEHLDKLIEAGIDSIKIEGRVKKAFYVATVVNAYRHVLDGENPELWVSELETISHRPYSTGFFFGEAEQSCSADIYTQLYDWVGEVKTSAPRNDGRFDVEVYCRNRFYLGDTLEVLSPYASLFSLTVEGLCEVFADDVHVPCEIANKAMGVYSIISDTELHPHDILRVMRKDPSQKN
ncbi:putative bacteriochlorophyll 4-vinyl reductase [Eggerthella sp. CAG:368]|nr:putative bacteriochlorophyll 4-vinyl reductase [Eggerthella sp. CAG:368]